MKEQPKIFSEKHHTFFNNQKCEICKSPASFYRYSTREHKGRMLCTHTDCDYKSLVMSGYISLFPISEVSNL
jgi:hypothetical protein